MTKPKPKQDRPATKTFYSEQFTTDELALVAAFVADPTLDDEIWMQRVLNHRLMAHANLKDPEGEGPSTDVLIKLAEALAIGTGRVARLLRDKRIISGETAGSLSDVLAEASEEIERARNGKHVAPAARRRC